MTVEKYERLKAPQADVQLHLGYGCQRESIEMAEPHRIVWICQECKVEYSSRILDDRKWHSWSETVCPNGHRWNVFARIDTPEHAWDAVQAWFEYHRRTLPRFEGPITIEQLTLGVALGMARTAISESKFDFEEPLSSRLEVVRELIQEAVDTLASADDVMRADLIDAQTGNRKTYVGSPVGFRKIIYLALERLPDRIEEAERYPWDSSAPLLIELEQLYRLSRRLDYRCDELETKLDRLRQVVAQYDARQKVLKEESEERARERQWDLIFFTAMLVVGAVLIVWSLVVVYTLVDNHNALLAWLSGVEPNRYSVQRAWGTRPDEIASAIQGGIMILGIVLLLGTYVLVQVPLFYFLVGLGLLLSFVVYKSLWMLVTGLIVLGIGSFVCYYWLERERGIG